MWVRRAAAAASQETPKPGRIHTYAALVSIHQNGTVSPTLGPKTIVSEKVAYFLLDPIRLAQPSYLTLENKLNRIFF